MTQYIVNNHTGKPALKYQIQPQKLHAKGYIIS